MATIVSKTIPGENGEYGPYYYHVEWVSPNEQKWTYLGPVNSTDPAEAAANHPDLDIERDE